MLTEAYSPCVAYALAKATREPLLFKGNEFAKTDVGAARGQGGSWFHQRASMRR